MICDRQIWRGNPRPGSKLETIAITTIVQQTLDAGDTSFAGVAGYRSDPGRGHPTTNGTASVSSRPFSTETEYPYHTSAF
jgi:hypothetical protein